MEAEPEQQPQEAVPDIEWWDVRICEEGATYDAIAAAAEAAGLGDGFAAAAPLLQGKITNLVQHPVPVQPPAEMPPPPPRPLMLTKKVRGARRRPVAPRAYSAVTAALACRTVPPEIAPSAFCSCGLWVCRSMVGRIWGRRSEPDCAVGLSLCQHARGMSY